MDRRSFFRSALDKGGKTVINAVDASVRKQASRWIRPPFALDELEFILACTRCGDCIEACPHEVIFGLSARVGAKFAGTPALDLLNKGCHLCADWPCVNACEPDALVLPEPAPAPGKHATELRGTRRSKPVTAKLAGKLSTASIDRQTCLPYSGPECGACIESCPVPGALKLDMSRPTIDPDICPGCGLCRQACITEPKAIRIASLYY